MALRLAGCMQGGYQENVATDLKNEGDQWLKAAAIPPAPSPAAGPRPPKPLAWL